MSRLTDLLSHARSLDAQLGADLAAEFQALRKRRTFGLVFEQHRPEAVELPSRPVRRGDKVRILPPRGETRAGDPRLWRVLRIEAHGSDRWAHLRLANDADDPETQVAPVADLVTVAEFRDPIYPGLVETGRVERGGDKPYHTVINAENFHALELLTYTLRHRVDVIYIDPPYNTGARDWKYNNDYVEADDDYRHSKWLAMMQRRLKIARELLNPDDSVLIVTIDEKEVHRLALLLGQVFRGAAIQTVTIVTNPSGTSRDLLSRVEEYALFVFVGNADPSRVPDNLLTTDQAGNRNGLVWESLLRRGNAWYRETRPNLCYPILIDVSSGRIAGVGDPFVGSDEAQRPMEIDGFFAAWPIRTDGRLGIWRQGREGLMDLAEKGYAIAASPDLRRGTWSLKYLMSGTVNAIEEGRIAVTRSGGRGEVEGLATRGGAIAKTVWNRPQHNAGMHGSALLRAVLPGRAFPFPKSLYAVEDALRVAVGDKPDAVILDFFAGSGTTAHAVIRLNRQDGGHRQSILVTNNEVAADEQKALRTKDLRPGDPEWEQWGICDYITKPRIEAAITGRTPGGEPIKGDYKFTDQFPMSEGFEENAAFFTLTYESPLSVAHHRAFAKVTPLLWLRAGSAGRIIDDLGDRGWDVADAYGVLEDLDNASDFIGALTDTDGVRLAFIVTDDDSAFEFVCRELPSHVSPIRLYQSYLQSFRINPGRGG